MLQCIQWCNLLKIMTINKVLTRDNKPTDELQRLINKEYKGVKFNYSEVYYFDFEVNEDTGSIDNNKLVEHFTKDQVDRNMKSLKSAFMVAKGAIAPKEISDFRAKYKIAASSLSIILGFSKNTISNIENGGIASLPSGRFIKVCLNNIELLCQYVESCSSLDIPKKQEIIERLRTNF